MLRNHSKKQTFLIKDEDIRNDCLLFINDLPSDVIYEVTIQPYKSTRSQAQNRLMWGAWYPVICDYTGYTKEELHEIIKAKFFGVKEVVTRDLQGNKMTIHLPNGSTTKLKVHDPDPDTPCMVKYLQLIETLASDLGLTLPFPNEYSYAMTGVI